MSDLTYFENNATAVITFSRPQNLNALNSQVFGELNELLEGLEQSSKIKVVVLTGEGKAFVAGADISEMEGKNKNQAQLFSEIGHRTLLRIEKLPQPVIGAINGYALGGGLELALACDFLFASDQAKFSAPEVNLGLIPGFGGTQRLARVVGLNNARFFLCSASMFTANEALKMGLVQKIYPIGELMNETLKMAEIISQKGPDAIQAMKRVVYTSMAYGFDAGSHKEIEEFAQLFEGQASEGMRAFLEKRNPEW